MLVYGGISHREQYLNDMFYLDLIKMTWYNIVDIDNPLPMGYAYLTSCLV